MASIGDVVGALGKRDGVEAVIILGNDGLPIASHVANGGDPEVLAALIPGVVTAGATFGQHAARGALATSVLEYDNGYAVIAHLSADTSLLMLVRARTNIGPLLYDLSRHRAEIAGLLQLSDAAHHLLVIDDEPFVGQIIRLLFEKGPFRVSSAQDGTAGLAFLEAHPDVRCVLVDINMPGMTGLDVVERARATPALKDLMFVILTAAGDALLPARAESLGVRAFITKPFSPNKLYRQVCDLIGVDAGTAPPERET